LVIPLFFIYFFLPFFHLSTPFDLHGGFASVDDIIGMMDSPQRPLSSHDEVSFVWFSHISFFL
jgi:hypothetical protein